MSRSGSPSDDVPSAARGEKNLQFQRVGENQGYFPDGRHARDGAGLESERGDGRRGEPEALLTRRPVSKLGSPVTGSPPQGHDGRSRAHQVPYSGAIGGDRNCESSADSHYSRPSRHNDDQPVGQSDVTRLFRYTS